MIKHSNKMLALFLAAVLFMIVFSTAHAGIIYVDAGALPGGDGTTWITAYDNLNVALAGASTGDSIWVAEGTYYPHASDRDVSFTLATGVALFGGFAGGETSVAERDWMTNVTILSGDIGLGDDDSDNSYHVVTGIDADSTAVLDGFTITLGNADGAEPDNLGGGIYLSGGNPVLTNLIVTENSASSYGGGLYCYDILATISNAVFSDNSADVGGGGMSINESAPTIVNSIFIGNSCAGRWSGGGGLGSNLSTTTLINVTMVNNDAGTGYGGAMSGYIATPRLINVIIWGNTAENSYNPQIWNNTSTPEISYSLIEGCGGSGGSWDGTYGLDLGNNIDEAPLFLDEISGDLRLKAVSPAVNSGNDAVPGLPAVDFNGDPRIAGTTVDRGAYERQCPAGAIVYVDKDAAGLNDGSSWTDAFTDLQEALEWATCAGVDEIWVADGTYLPTGGSDRSVSFQLVNGVTLYGGFSGMETSAADRDSLGGGTILSGDIGQPGFDEDNSYHVVVGSGTDSTAVLNGFTVTAGYADGSDTDGYRRRYDQFLRQPHYRQRDIRG